MVSTMLQETMLTEGTMYERRLNTPDAAAWTDRIGRRLRKRMTPVGMLSLLLVAVVLAADGRTILKTGWNMFSPQQDVEVGQQVSPDAERQLPMLKNARLDNYVNVLGRRLAPARLAKSTRITSRS